MPNDSTSTTTLGERIKAARNNKGLTLAKLSAFVGVSPQQLGNIENRGDGISPESLFALSDLLGVDARWLATGKDGLKKDNWINERTSAESIQLKSGIKSRLVLPVSTEVRARTLLAHLWRKYDAAGISMGRSHESVVLEAVLSLLGDPDPADMERLDQDSGVLVNETRDYLSARRAVQLGLK